MKKNNSILTLSGNLIIERDCTITDKIEKMNSGHVVEFKRSELIELSNNSITSKSFFDENVFLAGVKGFCFFPERPSVIRHDLPAHFAKYKETAFFNTDPSDFIEFFDFNSGFFDHHHSLISSRFLDFGSVDFIAFHAKKTSSLTIFLDLFFIDNQSRFTATISCASKDDALVKEIISVDFNLNEIINISGTVNSLASSIFKTLVSCLMSLISMDYSLFCSSISESNKKSVMSIQYENFNKVIKNDFLSSGLSDEKTIEMVKNDMFLFFSKTIELMLA